MYFAASLFSLISFQSDKSFLLKRNLVCKPIAVTMASKHCQHSHIPHPKVRKRKNVSQRVFLQKHPSLIPQLRNSKSRKARNRISHPFAIALPGRTDNNRPASLHYFREHFQNQRLELKKNKPV